jgi:hypothetical protein
MRMHRKGILSKEKPMSAHSLSRKVISTSLRAFHSDYLVPVQDISTRQAQAEAHVEMTCVEGQECRIPRHPSPTSAGSCYATTYIYRLLLSEASRLDSEVGVIFVYVVRTALQVRKRW